MSKDDESVVLPKAVRDQMAAADAIYDEVYKTEEPAPEPEPEPKPEPTPELDEDHKYKVLKGKYDKEVPRLHRQLREAQQYSQQLLDRMNKLEIQLQNMKTQPKPKEPEAPALTQDEIDTFGPDLIDIIRRVAKQETGVVLDQSLRPVKESVKQVQETVAQEKQTMAKSAREKLIEALDEKVPEWKTLNTDEDFLNWLEPHGSSNSSQAFRRKTPSLLQLTSRRTRLRRRKNLRNNLSTNSWPPERLKPGRQALKKKAERKRGLTLRFRSSTLTRTSSSRRILRRSFRNK
jgi:hypothetical protein